MKKTSFILLTLFTTLTSFSLMLFSFTQVDLNLTLINWTPYLNLQKAFTALGYFNRPLNSLIYLGCMLLLVLNYALIVSLSAKNKLSQRQLYLLIGITSSVLFFSYTAFSHDLFNYMFDAKIVTTYHLNPYDHKALDFQQDPWIRFMRWTHRKYPYGPTWLLITLVPSFLGFGKLITTLILFKALFVGCYIAIIIFIRKILSLLGHEKKIITAIALFAFSPLILVEGIVSPHLDLVMGAISLVAFYYYLSYRQKSSQKINFLYGWIKLLISIGVKFASVVYLPLFCIPARHQTIKKTMITFVGLSLLAALLQLTQGHLETWYFILLLIALPLAIPFTKLKNVFLGSLVISIAMIWVYYIFISTGVDTSLFKF